MTKPSTTSTWLRTIRTIAACLLVLAATPWAADARQAPTPAPLTLDQILAQVSTYDGGIKSDALWRLRDYVYARKDDAAGRAECETKLLAFLKTKATPSARMAAAKHLRVMAGDTAVPALQAMLSDPSLADLAVYVLQPMPGAAAEAALLQAMTTATGRMKTGIVVALGQRRAPAAVPALSALLQQPPYAVAAATALGMIGGEGAATSLTTVFGTASAELRPVAARSLLAAADSLLAAKNTAAALRIYVDVLGPAKTPAAPLPAPVRRAAALGKIAASGADAEVVLVGMLSDADPVLQSAAIAKIKDVFAPDTIKPVCEILPKLGDAAKVQVLAALGGYPGQRVAAVVLAEIASGNEPVRVAALQTYSAFASVGAVEFLTGIAAKSRGAEQAAARAALGNVKGKVVDDDIVALLAKRPGDTITVELLIGAADRRVFLARSAVAGLLSSPSKSVRAQALKTLRTIGTPSDVSAVIGVLVKSDDEGERGEAEKTVAALAAKTANADGRARIIRPRLAATTPAEERIRLIAVLPLMGDNSVLPVVPQTALDDKDPAVVDAAVRAIAAWQTAAVRDDVRRIALESKNETHRLLALGAMVRVIGLEPYRRPDAAVADLSDALGLATRPEERKLVLGMLPTFPCRSALDLATKLVGDPDVKAEAQAAVAKITAGQGRGPRR